MDWKIGQYVRHKDSGKIGKVLGVSELPCKCAAILKTDLVSDKGFKEYYCEDCHCEGIGKVYVGKWRTERQFEPIDGTDEPGRAPSETLSRTES